MSPKDEVQLENQSQPDNGLQRSHVCINGRVLVFPEPPANVTAFIDRVRSAAEDPKLGENDLIALVYGSDNPILDQGMLPGRPMVTKEVLDNPIYRVLTDFIDQKRVREGKLNLEKTAASYTMTTQEAADQLGISKAALIKAIDAGRLPVWVKQNRYYLNPSIVESFPIERRGPPPRLHLRFGSAPGISFRVKVPGELEDVRDVEAQTKEAWLSRWKRIAIIMGGTRGDKKTYRFFVLEPGGAPEKIELGPFFVEGRFRIVEKINNSAKAHEAWRKCDL